MFLSTCFKKFLQPRALFLGLIVFSVSAAHGRAVTYGNLSVGKFYNVSRAPHSSYPDRWANDWCSGAKLTDEDTGIAWPLDQWVGWYDEGVYSLDIILDLGKVYEVDKLRIRLSSRQQYGIEFADSVQFYTRSDTSEQWQAYGSAVTNLEESYSYQAQWVEQQAGTVNARYIKYELISPESAHMFISEIEAWGNIANSWKHVPDWGCYHGAYASNTNYWMSLGTFENQIQKQSSITLWYASMGASNFKDYLGSLWKSQYGLTYNLDYSGARLLEVGWEPQANITAEDIAGGYYDQYFETFFTESIDYANRNGNTDPVWLRPMSEMNGGWTFPPNAAAWGGDHLNFRRAWRRMFNIAEQVGTEPHHIFVWSPNGYTYSSLHMPDNYYPGDQYVDWLGISIYPQGESPYPEDILTGTAGPGSFDFYGTYGYKPIIISEGAYRLDSGIDGIEWINQWFDLPYNYPMIKALVWFYIHDSETNSLVTEPYMSLYRRRLAEPYYLTQSVAGVVDLDRDGFVNLCDYEGLAGNWGGNISNLAGDITGNNTVNIEDLLIFSEYWLKNL
ncbi:Beta-mannanase [Limihaloglobus sulfuriphilus]|uniref:Beta-mannanase n=1 Tax=Limihaloglobus sulfuriphilus TaxID=1851148 RepID=A0A1Q2MGI7_9BACT|nr:glycosyl hydrolase [Limihaloglobus sulfuriphilus]AQQ71764.1 Beta-mannanase [Limihaloglobus sulfuriphilus]